MKPNTKSTILYLLLLSILAYRLYECSISDVEYAHWFYIILVILGTINYIITITGRKREADMNELLDLKEGDN